MFNIYRMLFLALKNVETVKFWLLLRFPTSNKKTQKNFPSLLLGGPSPSLNTIWKTLHAVSKVNAMKKKNEKGHAKNKCDEKKPLEFLEFLLFYFTYGNSRQSKASPLEAPQKLCYTLSKF